MSVFDMMNALGESGEKIKSLMNELPASLDKWGKFQEFLMRELSETKIICERIEFNTVKIMTAMDISGLPEELARDVIANSVNDPRNGEKSHAGRTE